MRRPIHCTLFLIIFVFSILLIIPRIADATARVEPSKFIFTLKPGERITDAIKVTNTEDREVEYTAVIYDWTLDQQDNLVIFPAGKQEDSLKSFIKFNPQRFKLAPGKSQYIRFTLSAPKKGEWLERKGIIFFEQELPPQSSEIGATVVTQVGATVYLSFTETLNAFHLLSAEVEIREENLPFALLGFSNEGEAHIRYRIAYKIVNQQGSLLYEDRLGEQILLPGFERLISFPLCAEIGSGEYNLLLEVSFEGTTEKYNTVRAFTVP